MKDLKRAVLGLLFGATVVLLSTNIFFPMDIKDGQLQDLMSAPYLSKAPSSGSILIAVVSAWAQAQRMESIERTWAKLLPPNVQVVYFVGRSEGRSKSTEIDSAFLQQRIIALPNVTDNEYPPVRKVSEMFKFLGESIGRQEISYDWIFKADDDTYINVANLQLFLKNKDPHDSHFYGKGGRGRPEDAQGLKRAGLNKPYCMGGPGYVMSHKTLSIMARGMDLCLETVSQSKYRNNLWHSDVLIGLCVQKHTGVGCWEDKDGVAKETWKKQQQQSFVHDVELERKIEDRQISLDFIPVALSLHPFKTGMERIHQSILNQITRPKNYEAQP